MKLSRRCAKKEEWNKNVGIHERGESCHQGSMCLRSSWNEREHYRRIKEWEKLGRDNRVESNNNDGICGHGFALNKALCFFFLNNFLQGRMADGSTYLCTYLDLVNSISQHSLCYGLAAASRSQAKQIILPLIKTYESEKHSYKQKKLKLAQSSLIVSLQ